VQELRAERSTRHPGATVRRSYPTVRLMRCTSCGSTYFGDANLPDSLVSELIGSPNVMRLKEELGTNPKVYYLV